jgi:hypothetical protein
MEKGFSKSGQCRGSNEREILYPPTLQEIFSAALNPNSHQNSHLTKTKKATSRAASATY